jgi:hypothetical protein
VLHQDEIHPSRELVRADDNGKQTQHSRTEGI